MFQQHCYFCYMKLSFFKIKQKLDLNNTAKNIDFLERFYIKKYGSRHKAELVIKELKEKSSCEDDFKLALQEKIKSDLHYKSLKPIIKAFLNAKSIKELLKNILIFKSSSQSKKVENNIGNVSDDFKQLINPAFEEAYGINKSSKDDIINYINHNVNLNLANTRKELGYPDPRTFNHWLKFFFDSRFEIKLSENKSKNSGQITLFEYLEIVSAFILSYDEKKLNFSKPEEILRRFELQKQTQKQVLKKLTNNNYSYLREKLEDITDSEIYKDKFGEKSYNKNKSKIPYSLVTIIKEHIEYGYLR